MIELGYADSDRNTEQRRLCKAIQDVGTVIYKVSQNKLL